jgi:hypothetical protein
MKYLFSPKIRAWRWLARQKNEKARGTISLVTVFMFFIFSILGLGMLFLSQIHLKLSAFKKHSTFLEYASENGIKQGFEHVVHLLTQLPAPFVITQEKFDELRANGRNQGTKIIEEALGEDLPLILRENWENLSWECSANFFLKLFKEKEKYFSSISRMTLDSEGMMNNFKPRRKSSLEADLGILAGYLPLPFFPFLLDKKLGQDEKANFIEKNNITFMPAKENSLQPQINFSEGELIPEDVSGLLSVALKIKIFYPQNLSWPQLRRVLGLEESNEPVPEGVYLIKDDLGLGGIYIQGDLDEMIFAIQEDSQVISFRMPQGSWLLKFSPSQSKTIFLTHDNTLFYDLIPNGMIVVNGKINSLGGGIVDSSGNVTLAKEEEIPSILRGVNLTIISSDKITVSSHLIHQGIKWQEGVPYIKDSNSQLIIFSTGKDFWEDTAKEGKIVIDEDAPQEIKIQASLTAGSGFSIEGEKKIVHLLGSLQASDYTSNNNALKITVDEKLGEGNNFPLSSPETSSPILHVFSLKVKEWKEN